MNPIKSVSFLLQAKPQEVENKEHNSNGLLDADARKSHTKFRGMVENRDTTNDGKELPHTDGTDLQRPEKSLLSEASQKLNIRETKALRLVTGEGSVTDESFISFMQDQGLSRSEIAELLISKKGMASGKQIDGTTTNQWMQLKHGSSALSNHEVDIAHTVKKSKSNALTEAIFKQTNVPSGKTNVSVVVDVIATKTALEKVLAYRSENEELTTQATRLVDLMSVLTRRSTHQNSGGHGHNQSDTGSFSERSVTDENISTTIQTKDFREFLAEHLRRADSLKELSDRLGTMIARQISGQIGKGRWNLELTLHPAELGSIEVDMEMTERGLEASFRATQTVTRDLLMESMPRLKSWFEEGGIDVAYTGVESESNTQNGENSTEDGSSEEESGSSEVDNGLDGAETIQITSTDFVNGFDIRV